MRYSCHLFCLFIAFKFAKSILIGHIAGGSFTTYNQYPHSVFLNINCDSSHVCGGSILNQDLILTAAHCMDGCEKLTKVTVVIKYGHERLSNMKTTYMRRYMIHQEYNGRNMDNDICMMSTVNKILLGKVAKRIIIMKTPPRAKYAYTAGWGVDENNRAQLTLKHTPATIQNTEVCQSMGRVPMGSFCAGPMTGLGAPEMGDSGNALVINGYIQIGLVSFKIIKYSLVTYTNVSFHLGWIERQSPRLVC